MTKATPLSSPSEKSVFVHSNNEDNNKNDTKKQVPQFPMSPQPPKVKRSTMDIKRSIKLRRHQSNSSSGNNNAGSSKKIISNGGTLFLQRQHSHFQPIQHHHIDIERKRRCGAGTPIPELNEYDNHKSRNQMNMDGQEVDVNVNNVNEELDRDEKKKGVPLSSSNSISSGSGVHNNNDNKSTTTTTTTTSSSTNITTNSTRSSLHASTIPHPNLPIRVLPLPSSQSSLSTSQSLKLTKTTSGYHDQQQSQQEQHHSLFGEIMKRSTTNNDEFLTPNQNNYEHQNHTNNLLLFDHNNLPTSSSLSKPMGNINDNENHFHSLSSIIPPNQLNATKRNASILAPRSHLLHHGKKRNRNIFKQGQMQHKQKQQMTQREQSLKQTKDSQVANDDYNVDEDDVVEEDRNTMYHSTLSILNSPSTSKHQHDNNNDVQLSSPSIHKNGTADNNNKTSNTTTNSNNNTSFGTPINHHKQQPRGFHTPSSYHQSHHQQSHHSHFSQPSTLTTIPLLNDKDKLCNRKRRQTTGSSLFGGDRHGITNGTNKNNAEHSSKMIQQQNHQGSTTFSREYNQHQPRHNQDSLFTSKANLIKTPPRKKNHDSNNYNNITTPTRMTPNSLHRHYNSPGGFALQRLLEGCMTPQLAYRKRDTTRFNYHNVDGGTISNGRDQNEVDQGEEGLYYNNNPDNSVCESSKGSLNNELDDWHEACLSLPEHIVSVHNNEQMNDGYDRKSNLLRGEVDMMDWSMKKMIKIECHPGGCVPGRLVSGYNSRLNKGSNGSSSSKLVPSTFLNPNRIEKLATDLFMNHLKEDTNQIGTSVLSSSSPKRSIRKVEAILSLWQAGLKYWQYPSVHPLPPTILKKAHNTHRSKRSSSRSNGLKSTSNHGGLGVASDIMRRLGPDHSSSLSSSSRSRLHSETRAINSLTDYVHGSQATIQQRSKMACVGSLGGLGEDNQNINADSCGSRNNTISTVEKMLEQRKYEWQECFRSLFLSWMSQISELNEDIKDETINGNLSDIVSRLYFYSISTEATILFRAMIVNETEDHHISDICVKPVILISASSMQMRSTLKAFGTKIRIVPQHNNYTNTKKEINTSAHIDGIDEEFIDEWFKVVNTEKNKVDDTFVKELEELRRATANGESVGAEVSFNLLKSKRNKTKVEHKKKPTEFPPIFVMDHNDCMNFFEYYLNTCGGTKISPDILAKKNDSSPAMNVYSITKDVPLLLCRAMGPSKYMTQKQLTVLENKNNNQVTTADDKNGPKHSLVDIRGPIMPCAVRDLLCASVSHLLLEKERLHHEDCNLKKNPEQDDSHSNDMDQHNMNDENELGSHYFVMHLHAHDDGDGDQPTSKSKSHSLDPNTKMVGRKTSIALNGMDNLSFKNCCPREKNRKDSDKEEQDEAELFQMKECNVGDVITMAVWDINRPLSIAYKSDPIKDITLQ